MLKQVIVVNGALDMGRGKTAAQVAHASLGAYDRARKSSPGAVDDWKVGGQRKIVVKAGSSDELQELRREAEIDGLPCYLVEDAGLTQLEPGSVTALAIGPAESREIDPLTGDLSLL